MGNPFPGPFSSGEDGVPSTDALSTFAILTRTRTTMSSEQASMWSNGQQRHRMHAANKHRRTRAAYERR